MSDIVRFTPGGAGVPDEPSWDKIYPEKQQQALASAMWREIVSEMKSAGTLSPANGHAIKRLVCFMMVHDDAQKSVTTRGHVLEAKRTGVAMVNPDWSIARQASELIRKLEADLGISPRRRASAAKVTRPRPATIYSLNPPRKS